MLTTTTKKKKQKGSELRSSDGGKAKKRKAINEVITDQRRSGIDGRGADSKEKKQKNPGKKTVKKETSPTCYRTTHSDSSCVVGPDLCFALNISRSLVITGKRTLFFTLLLKSPNGKTQSDHEKKNSKTLRKGSGVCFFFQISVFFQSF